MLKYPNGKPYNPKNITSKNTMNKKSKDFSFGNRGKTLEDEINETNAYYLSRQIAIIHKKPVPIQIVKVEYPKRSAAVIREAYFRTPSTTDYNGVWNGYYIDFEAKETESTTSFPLKNVHEHQITHMKNVVNQQGIAFTIVRFSKLNRYFLLPFSVLYEAWSNMKKGGRKSIPLGTFESKSYEIIPGYNPRIDYISAIKKLISGEN
ncbi:Holliday junction resolvase RecU [Ureibacillus sp. FSL K6-8385]|uniref:Holliday junction resolvase RecU n=1 Tax=Ureibacillus terrenus TaxID=118246 RepID=A0A540V6L0_9BACL|nr:Holliday junction resolvase RecU [Ureibacillus terrenus]MED3660663.1 Holliday junction resolvase RecU [Ureibacillus terrenus]MED3762783.1 Holliday junction resolvase RecU [Ureibacillus terrenus]TQE92345.1 Holliday junction resolvase RecU [Ureibacillus terrenus]